MILFHSETKFSLDKKSILKKWIKNIISLENKKTGDINYIFCDDEQLLAINQEYLKHDTYTDIITFDYTENNIISGDIYISIERVKENASTFNVAFKEEKLRVMAHGILHLCGYPDKSETEAKIMRSKENEAINLYKDLLQIKLIF